LINQRDPALGILDSKISELSKLFKECYTPYRHGLRFPHVKSEAKSLTS
jgi:hypothetical protein